jgi:hypothetical protein
VGWLSELNVRVTIVEVAHDARGYDLADLGEDIRARMFPCAQRLFAGRRETA